MKIQVFLGFPVALWSPPAAAPWSLHGYLNSSSTGSSIAIAVAITIAVAIAIYLGNKVEFNEDELLNADNDYLRWYNEIRIFKYQLKIAEQQGNEMRIDMFEARIDQYTPKYNNAKQQVDALLDQAETLLFDTK